MMSFIKLYALIELTTKKDSVRDDMCARISKLATDKIINVV